MLVNIESKFSKVEQINPLVSKFKCYIAKPCIANNYIFTKDVLDNNDMKITIPSSPVVAGFIDCDDGSRLGGHEADITRTSNGLRRTPRPQAIGYCCENEPFWEEFQGEEWLTTYVILWTDYFEGLQNLSERKIYQSMEIQENNTSDGKYKMVTGCILNALCMLEGVFPAFENSTFVPTNFSKQDFSDDVKILKHEFDSLINKQNKNGGDKLDNIKDNKIKFATKEDWGSGDYEIKVKKSKGDVSNNSWGDIDKTALMNKTIKAKNGKKIVHDIYALVEDGYEESPSKHLKYPIMEIKSNNEAVYNEGALSSALAYANHTEGGNKDVADKIAGIQWKLGLLKNSDKTDTSKGGDKNKMNKKFKKEDKETYAKKFSMTVNEIISVMNDIVSSQTFNGTEQKYSVWDFDDIYMYGYDNENHCSIAIPFDIGDDGSITPDFEHVVHAKNVSIWIVADTDDYDNVEDDSELYENYSKTKCSKVDKELNDTKTELSNIKDQLTASQAETGKKFAEVTSLETALADEKKANEDKQKQIDEMSAKLKASADEENMSKAKALMSNKEFSVFSKEIKDNMLANENVKSFDKFETYAYAELGKFTSTHLDYDSENAKFSFMYTPNIKDFNNNSNDENNVYAEVRKKFSENNNK